MPCNVITPESDHLSVVSYRAAVRRVLGPRTPPLHWKPEKILHLRSHLHASGQSAEVRGGGLQASRLGLGGGGGGIGQLVGMGGRGSIAGIRA